jgi:hypothetical protein
VRGPRPSRCLPLPTNPTLTTIFTAEATALQLTSYSPKLTILIASHSLSCLQALQTPRPTHPIILRVLLEIHSLQTVLHRGWCSSGAPDIWVSLAKNGQTLQLGAPQEAPASPEATLRRTSARWPSGHLSFLSGMMIPLRPLHQQAQGHQGDSYSVDNFHPALP